MRSIIPYSISGPGAVAVLEYSTTYDAYQTDKRSGAIVHKITHASESNEHKEIKSYARGHRGSLNPPKSSQPLPPKQPSKHELAKPHPN